MKSVRLLAVLACMTMTSAAHAEFGILGGVNIASPSFDPASTATIKGKTAIAGGLYFSKGLSPLLTLELDALYVQNKFDLTGTGFNLTRSFNMIQIPVIARFNFSPFWNIGAGLYYAFAMSDKVKTTDNDSGASVEDTFAANNMKKSDYGVLGSVQIRIPAGPVKILVDGRYVMGLAEQSTDAATKIKSKSIQGFAGLGWGW